LSPVTERQGLGLSHLPKTLKGTNVLAPQNHVNLSNLTTIRSIKAGALTARAWDTLRSAVTRDGASVQTVADIPASSPMPNLPLMRRGAERC
jgi:hypothetical protein